MYNTSAFRYTTFNTNPAFSYQQLLLLEHVDADTIHVHVNLVQVGDSAAATSAGILTPHSKGCKEAG